MASTSSNKVALRSDTPQMYLIGHTCMQILGAKLPSNKQVLQMYFFNTMYRHMDSPKSALLVADAVMIFWRQAGIEMQLKENIQKKIIKLRDKYRDLQKHSARGGATHNSKEAEFIDKLDDLFDIASADALTKMKNKEDIEFLQKQRLKGRVGSMIGVDEVSSGIEKRRLEREYAEESRRKRQCSEVATAGEFRRLD